MRLIIDTANGSPKRCLEILNQSINLNKAINDLNWVRLKSWRESLAMIFDPPSRSCLLYTSPSPRDRTRSRMPSSA